MDSSRHQRLSELFDAARQVPAAQREAFLRESCGDDRDLLEQVRSLLEHHEHPDQPLSGPLVDQPLEALKLAGGGGLSGGSTSSSLPQRIGRYQIVRLLGEGGMGTVFEAQQDNPRRTVALKVIHAGIASTKMLRRFEHEAQILGRLQHPGIAQIFEAGTFESGAGGGGPPQPFFAMEFVNGVSVTDFAAAHNLTARQRMDLVARIGDAVQHAHQKGVIHRDLKPGNILVDAAGQPKILDFGVARVTDSDIQVTTLQTDVGQLIGTLPYMSPEQASGDADALDTRSDVYALGVLAYELLAGRLPYDLKPRLVHEAVRVIRDEEPTRLSSINRTFRGDIETIVGKALEKDRARRYQTASDLAEDIRRYLRDEAVIARPPSRAYQFRKFAKRNKAVVIGVSAVFIALIAGVVGTSMALLRAIDAEHVALQRLDLIAAEKANVEREKAKVDAVSKFQQELLQSVDPRMATTNRDITVREALDQAAKKVDEGSLAGQPEIEGAVRYILGATYFSLGEYDLAREHLEKSQSLREQAVGVEHLDTAETIGMLGETWREKGDLDKAEPLTRQALEIRRRLTAVQSAELASSLNNMALIEKARGRLEECERLNREALAMRRVVLEPDDDALMQSLNNLAMVLVARRGDPKEIDALYQEGIEFGERLYHGPHPNVAHLLQNQAQLRETTGDVPGAIARMREALEVREAVYGPEHALVAESLNNLGAMLRRKGDFAEVEPLYRRALAIRTSVFGPDDPRVAESLNNMCILLQNTDRAAEGEPLMRRALEIRRAIAPGDDAMVALYMSNLANNLVAQFKMEEGEALTRQAIEMRERLGDTKSASYALALLNLAAVMRDRSAAALPEVERTQRRALETLRGLQPASPPQIAMAQNNLGTTLRELDRLDEAEAMLRESLDTRKRLLGEDSALTAATMHNLAVVLLDRGQLDDAATMFEQTLVIRRAKLASGSIEMTPTLMLLGATRMRQGRAADAEPMLREALEIRVRIVPAGHPRIADCQALLAECLAEQGKYDEAQPLMMEGCEILLASEHPTIARKRQAADAAARMFEAAGDADSAATWRARRDALRAPAYPPASAPAESAATTRPL